MSEHNPVIAAVRGRVGFLELNRPKALNSLDTRMAGEIQRALDSWRYDDDVTAVVIYSNHHKAFCAGGDVRMVREAILAGDVEYGDNFLNVEYTMNAAIANYPKPYIALIDGVAMGGGLGISAHGSRRIISERSWASMPEMAIGFCPDVGMTYMFQRMVNATGSNSYALAKFLVLTTWRMSPQDMMWSGLATDYVPAARHSELLQDMTRVTTAEELSDLIDEYAQPLEGASQLAELLPDIEAVFSVNTWDEVVQRLDSYDNQEFVELVEGSFTFANPTSLVAAMELMTANEHVRAIRSALSNEFAVGRVLRRDRNFLEGVRTVLVDKDRSPSFDPAKPDHVDPAPFRKVLIKSRRQ